jgi:glycosyltransferase involved in cell wall biosynthesis
MTTHRPTVAVVAPRFPPVIGGMELYASRVARALHADPDWDVVVITTDAGTRPGESIDDDGLRVVRLRRWATLSNTPVSPRWPLELRRLFDHYGVDLVNAHSPVPFLADVAALAAGRRPLVVTYHAGSMRKGAYPADALIIPYERWIRPRLFDRAAAVVSYSAPFVDRELRPWSSKVVFIPPGVDADVFVPPVAEPSEAPVVLYVGRIDLTSAWKGIDVLLRSMVDLRRQVPGARLDLVGGGDAVPSHRTLADSLGLGDAVTFRGPLRGADLVAAYQRAAVVVLPSLTAAEAFGIVLIEAMACGRPVVGSAVGGIPGVIEDGADGLLVPPGDPAALARSVGRLLTDSGLRQAMGRRGRAKVDASYDWSVPTGRHLGVFANVLGR